MQTYDILMLAVLVGAIAFGAYRGFVWQLASLASIGVSYVVAVRFREPVARMIGGEPPWNALLAMLLLYIGTSVVIWLAFRAISKTIDSLQLTGFDRQIGALFGAIKGVILCAIITLLAVMMLDESQRQSVIDSRSGYYVAQLLSRVHGVLPADVHEALEPYFHRLDERLDDSDPILGEAEAGEEAGPTAAGDGEWPDYEPLPASIPGR